MRVARLSPTSPREFLSACFDDPWMWGLLRRHGLRPGRIGVVTLLLFHQAKLPLAVVRDFLRTLGDVTEPRAVLDRAEVFVQRVADGR